MRPNDVCPSRKRQPNVNAITGIVLCLFLLLNISACNPYVLEATTVTIDGVTYRKGFYDDLLYPTRENMAFQEELYTVNDKEYRRVDHNGFNFVHTDGGGNAAGRLYCAQEQWEQAQSYYADSDNFAYFCSIGVKNDSKGTVPVTVELLDVDPEKFDSLMDFAEEYGHKLFGSENKNTRRVEYPDKMETPPLLFYKSSQDGCLHSHGRDFYVYDDALLLRYQYDHGNGEYKEMIVVDVPDELSEYFVAFVENIGSGEVSP